MILEIALPILLSGAFSFVDTVIPAGRLTVDVVDTRMPDAEQRLEELKASGATCELKMSNTYRCFKFHRPEFVAQSSLEQIAQNNVGAFVFFGSASGAPTLLHDGTAVREWEIPQRVAIPAQDFTEYRLREQTDGSLKKIILPDGQEFIIESEDQLLQVHEVPITESRWRFHRDVAYVVLNREKKSQLQKAF